MPYLFLLFIVMPIIEIAVLIQVGGAIGGWTTIGIVILTAFVGTFMLRQQGMATLNKAQLRMQQGEMPAQQMLEGLLLLIGGILLLTPGFITDFFGFCTLVPVSRRFLATKLATNSLSKMNVFVGGAPMGSADDPGTRPSQAGGAPNKVSGAGKRDPDVIEGDYRRVD